MCLRLLRRILTSAKYQNVSLDFHPSLHYTILPEQRMNNNELLRNFPTNLNRVFRKKSPVRRHYNDM